MTNPADFAARMESFLAKRLPEARSVRVADYTPMTGGYSCAMTRFVADVDGVRHALIARADPPAGKTVIGTDRVAEWEVLDALTRDGSTPMPAARFVDPDGSELGARTIILDYVEGVPFLAQLRETDDSQRRGQMHKLCDLVATIHAVPVDVLPLAVARPTDWESYLDGLLDTWRETELSLQDSFPILRYMGAWLRANRPPPTPLTLVHGEFQTSNIVVGPEGNLLAVDWEFAHIGDPREDLGWCKWVEAVQPPTLIGVDDAEFSERYRAKSGLGEDIINPLTIAYFSILPAMRVFRGVMEQQQAFSEGSNSNIRNGYLVGAVVTAFEQWFEATRQIEQASRSGAAPARTEASCS